MERALAQRVSLGRIFLLSLASSCYTQGYLGLLHPDHG